MVPSARIHSCNPHGVNGHADYVLYWMIANRRRHWNFALQRAVHWATELRKPLLVVESLSCGYRWASARIHTAILQGMRDNFESFRGSGVLYHPFVERFPHEGTGMLETLARAACVVVTDDFPAFEIPGWIAAARAPVLIEKVDSNGIFPMRSTNREFVTARSFRRFLQMELRVHLKDFPASDSLADLELPSMTCPSTLRSRWAGATTTELSAPEVLANSIPVDRQVRPVAFGSGPVAARRRLDAFVRAGLRSYAQNHNQPEPGSSSGLSSHLHFGHISSHEIFQRVMEAVQWSPDKLSRQSTGTREHWWGAGTDVEAFLEQLVTWRELGFNKCAQSDNYDRYESLPQWAQKTLGQHAADPRPRLYTVEQFENAKTHDALWNAAQIQLLQEGHIHNYLRMLWGKKILEWSHTPQDALATMIHINNKYALDGRDPNSYSGIFWILGRYDRPWGPERPIFGTIRYMSSENTARKFHVRDYLQRYGGERPGH